MLLQNLIVVQAVDEIAGSYNNIRICVFFNVLHVQHEVGNIMIVYRRGEALLTIQNTQFSALRVDVVMRTRTQMFDQITRFFLTVDLYIINTGICHV